jgi:hypothetical protein
VIAAGVKATATGREPIRKHIGKQQNASSKGLTGATGGSCIGKGFYKHLRRLLGEGSRRLFDLPPVRFVEYRGNDLLDPIAINFCSGSLCSPCTVEIVFRG